MDGKVIRVGVKEGGGSPPGYRWSVWILNVAFDEAMSFLSPVQYEHLAMQFRELASQENPTHSDAISIRHMTPEDFCELRDKGGVLGNINTRVFFGVDKGNRAIVVLGSIKKQNDGPTPKGDIIRIRRRWRLYRNNEYGKPKVG